MPAGTASAMVKRLAELGLAEHTPYHGVRLTAEGRRVALRMLRRHRLLELFLAETLDLPWDRVHQEAELLEHSLSDELEAAIAERLGNPTHDPARRPDSLPGARARGGGDDQPGPARDRREARFVRVSDADPAILRHLGERGLRPGRLVRLVEHEPFGGAFVIRIGRRSESLPPRDRAEHARGAAARELASRYRGGPAGGGAPATTRRRRPALPRSSAIERARRGRVRTALPLLGPAFVAAVAYVDPGNFATNIGGGARTASCSSG